MRITIDIDNQDATPVVSPSTTAESSAATDALDGGAFGGPSAESDGTSNADAINAAGPPEWLVAEIAAAAAYPGADQGAGDEDAGAGPA